MRGKKVVGLLRIAVHIKKKYNNLYELKKIGAHKKNKYIKIASSEVKCCTYILSDLSNLLDLDSTKLHKNADFISIIYSNQLCDSK